MDCATEPTIERRYITRQEAATYAGVSLSTIARWIANGELRVTPPPVRTTREWVDEREQRSRVKGGGRTTR
jgi:predicted site-specific integrase-resolvase